MKYNIFRNLCRICMVFIFFLGLIAIICSGGGDSGGGGDDDDDDDDGGTGYILTKHDVVVELPYYVNIFFQTTDTKGNPISTLQNNDFIVYEDNETISPTESAQEVKKSDELPYTLRTVIMIDVSASISEQNLIDMKDAAKHIVNNFLFSEEKIEKKFEKEIAIYSFDDVITPESGIGFSDISKKSELISAIESIERGDPSTNLYGAIIEGLNLWSDSFSTLQIFQGFLIAITDGSDTAAISNLNAVLSARGQKKIFTIGVGSEIEPSILSQIGNAGNYNLDNYSQLESTLEQVSNIMEQYANSFYNLRYASPKRSGTHEVKLTVKSNTNTSSSGEITASFNASNFSSNGNPYDTSAYAGTYALVCDIIGSTTAIIDNVGNISVYGVQGTVDDSGNIQCTDDAPFACTGTVQNNGLILISTDGPVGSCEGQRL